MAHLDCNTSITLSYGRKREVSYLVKHFNKKVQQLREDLQKRHYLFQLH